jgi:hypothetical protein
LRHGGKELHDRRQNEGERKQKTSSHGCPPSFGFDKSRAP